MLPNSSRLREKRDFRDTLSHGVRAGREHVVVHVRGRDEAPSRAGFVVSKKVGNAVIRNRVKRRLRHLAPTVFKLFPFDVDVVVRALPGAETADLSHEFLAAAALCNRRLDAK